MLFSKKKKLFEEKLLKIGQVIYKGILFIVKNIKHFLMILSFYNFV